MHETAAPPAIRPDRQRRTGLLLATVIIAAWVMTHLALVFFWPLQEAGLTASLLMVVLQTWFSVGLFIVAHDCMHGSLAPFQPSLNRRIGQLCLLLYAGFDFDRLNIEHHKHHRHAGTAEDPDFDERPPHGFWHWFGSFFLHYFGIRQFLILAAVSFVYLVVFGADLTNLLVFWALPGLLSALQLFTFGTYLPHKPGRTQFADRHKARSQRFPVWLSLLTCFHFGYHHEHHLFPGLPWWRLPETQAKPRRNV